MLSLPLWRLSRLVGHTAGGGCEEHELRTAVDDVPLVRRRHAPHPDTYGAGPGRGLRWKALLPSVGAMLSSCPEHPVGVSRVSRGGLGVQGQVALPARNRRRIASPPAYASPEHPYRRIRCQLVMRAAITGRVTTHIALRAGRRELGAREPIQSGRTPPRSSVFTRYHL